MKILIIHNKYNFSGGEDTVVDNEADLLRLNGNDVELLFYSNNSFSSTLGKLMAPASTFYNFASSNILKERIKIFKPDVVHVHNLFYEASPSVLFTIHKIGIPVVMTVHNYRLICAGTNLLRNGQICELCINSKFGYNGIRYRCFQGSLLKTLQLSLVVNIHKVLNTWQNKIDKFIFLTEFSQQKFVNSSLNIDYNKTVVKANFTIDRGYSRFEDREDFILFVGRISPEKGIQTIISLAKSSTHNIEIIGDGPLASDLANALSCYPHVKIWGKQEFKFVIDRLKRCKALLFPSIWYEGLPMTIIEAFSTGTPVIAVNIDNINRIVTDKFNGFLFSKDQINELVESVEYLFGLGGKELYSNARNTYEQLYSPESNYNKLISIYKSVTTLS